MQVDSYLELFTTMYGWAFANLIGAALVSTGLFALPFLLIAFNAWRDAKESASAGASAVGLSEAIQVKLFVAIFVFVFAFCTTPFTTLTPGAISYTPTATAVNPNPTTATVGNTGTTYDNTLGQAIGSISSAGSSGGSLVSVPMWWYLVMAISEGMNYAVKGGITNAGDNLRDIQSLAREAAIEDPAVQASIQHFYNDCYLHARSVYLNMDRSTLSANGQSIIAPGSKYGGPTDVDWIGSQLFQTEPGFYQSMTSYYPVKGFVAQANDPINANVQGGDATGTTSQWGEPTCAQWWTDPSNGVRAAIIGQSTGATALGQLTTAVSNVFSSDAAGDQADAIARQMILKNPPAMVDYGHIYGADDAGIGTKIGRVVGGAAGSLLTGGTWLSTFMAYTHMTSAMPMAQALILMAIYMLLPLIVFLSGYKLEVMFYGAMAIFTVKFWTVLWFVANWIDNNLIKSMYNTSSVSGFFQSIYNNGPYKQMILDIILFGMYIGFPMIWSGMMTWIGIRVGGVLSDFMKGNAHPAANNPTGMSPGKAVNAANQIKRFVGK